MIYASIEVVGLKEALKELNGFDKRLRRQITRDYKEILRPVQTQAIASIQQIGDEPMSGWARAWNPRKGNKGRNQKLIPNLPQNHPLRENVRKRSYSVRQQLISEFGLKQAGSTDGVFPWDTQAATKMIKSRINTRAPKQFAGQTQNLNVFTISWLGAADAVFEMAGRTSGGKTPQGKQMIATLNQRYGPAGRILWRSYEQNRDTIDKQMKALVEKVMAAVNRRPIFGDER